MRSIECSSRFIFQKILPKSYYVTFGHWHRNFVCRLCVVRLSITLVHHTQTVEFFGNIVAPYCSVETCLGCKANSVKIITIFSPGIIMYKKVWKKRFSTYAWLYFANNTRYDHSYNRRRIEIRKRSRYSSLNEPPCTLIFMFSTCGPTDADCRCLSVYIGKQ